MLITKARGWKCVTWSPERNAALYPNHNFTQELAHDPLGNKADAFDVMVEYRISIVIEDARQLGIPDYTGVPDCYASDKRGVGASHPGGYTFLPLHCYPLDKDGIPDEKAAVRRAIVMSAYASLQLRACDD